MQLGFAQFGTRSAQFGVAPRSTDAPVGTFTCDTGPSVEFVGPDPSGTFDCDAGPTVEFIADIPSNFWNVDARHDVDFRSAPVGYLECSQAVEVEFEGYPSGAGAWEIDALTEVIWLCNGGVVSEACLVGDGRFREGVFDWDATQNYVF
jgi:hypothetical protein